MKNIRRRFFVSSAILLAFSSLLANAFQPQTNRNIVVAIDAIGIMTGIALLVTLVSTLKYFTGSLRKSYDFMLCIGIVFQVLALLYSLIFIRLGWYPIPTGIDIHHLLMITGLVFFGIAVYNLRTLLNQINKKG